MKRTQQTRGSTLAKSAAAAFAKDRKLRAAKRRDAERRAARELQLSGHKTFGLVQRLPDQQVKGRIAKPNVVIFLQRNFKAPNSLMSTRIWLPKRKSRYGPSTSR